MANQALAYGELLAGGVLIAAAWANKSVPEIVAGRGGPLAALTSLDLSGAGGGGGGSSALASADISSKGGTATFDGVKVCAAFIPILKSARKSGLWKGQVTSGFRTRAEQAAIHASGVYSAPPGQSNHEGCPPTRGAVDVSDPAGFTQAMKKLGMPLRNSLGSVDPVHFSISGR